MGAVPDAKMLSNFQFYQQPVVILSSKNEILFANESSKLIMESIENEYHTSFFSKMKWVIFLAKVRQQRSAVLELPPTSTLPFYIRIEGYFDYQQDIVTLFFKDGKQEVYEPANLSFFSMMNQLDVGIVVIQEDGLIVDINSHAAGIINCDREGMITKHFRNFKKHFDYNIFDLKQLLVELNQRDEGVLIVKRVTEDVAYYELKVKYDAVYKVYYIGLFNHTEYMQMQAQLKEQQILKEFGQMSASIAHEIRNPLTALKGFTDLLRTEAHEGQIPYFDIMNQEFDRLNTILTDLLDLSSPKRQVEQLIDLPNLVKDVVYLMQVEALEKGNEIQFEMPGEPFPKMKGNLVRLKQVLMNLVKNALQAMEKGTITIRLASSEYYIHLSVQDEGSGMSPEVCKNIFTPFYTTKDEGTGLGLPLVKKIIEDSDGFIEVESWLTIGSSFLLSFPSVEIGEVI